MESKNNLYHSLDIKSPAEMENIEDELWVKENEQRNRTFLDLFDQELSLSGLKESTVNNHVLNVRVFLETLGFREGFIMEEAVDSVGFFLGDWYIRRCMWSTPANIKTTAASIKKFVKCMEAKQFLKPGTYRHFNTVIKEHLPEWQLRCAKYNDPDYEFDFDDFFGF